MLIAILMFMASHVASVHAQIPRQSVHWDDKSLIFDGKRVVPVMGEVHYSRIPQDEWAAEVRKMKEGGVTIVATYVFWNHVEEVEGIYNWSGQRNLRAFLEVCKQQDMPVVLRLGPFCHGEVRNGGIPDWMFAKGCKMREENHTFLTHAQRLYAQIFTQVQGLQWKDGGPVIAAQFDNEYRGKGSYLMALKEIALRVGFDLPFYTRTGWPELRTPVPYGEMIPLYGDYADGFWDRSLEPTAGNYYKAFNFKAFRSSTAIATEQLGAQKEQVAEGEGQYPYFTCELGGGMMTAYHRRPYIYPEDAYSMAVVKLGMRDDMSSSDKITHSEKVSGNDAHDDASSMYIRRGKLLSIRYRGDCARLYVDGKLVADNFYNGRPFLMGLWRLPVSCSKLELRILPLQKSMPVYFPKEADVDNEGEEVKGVEIVNM